MQTLAYGRQGETLPFLAPGTVPESRPPQLKLEANVGALGPVNLHGIFPCLGRARRQGAGLSLSRLLLYLFPGLLEVLPYPVGCVFAPNGCDHQGQSETEQQPFGKAQTGPRSPVLFELALRDVPFSSHR